MHEIVEAAVEFAKNGTDPQPEDALKNVYALPELSYREAVRGALAEAMRADEDVFLMGEDIAEMGGSMGVTQGLLEEFGAERVRNTPISEMAIVGAGIGAAMQGMRPVVEIMYEDFLTLSLEQIVNQAAKHRYMSGGQLKVPLTIRTQGGAGWSPGAQHAQQLEAWLVHVPGLKVVFASSPNDVRGLLWSSIYDDNPVIFFEHRLLYPVKEEVPEKLEPIPLGKARVVREGTDVTVIATGPLVHRSLKAADAAAEEGISVEVVDPRTLQPLDEAGLVESVQQDEPRGRRARGGDADGLRRRGRGRAAGAGVRLPRRADRARRRQVRAARVRARDGAVRDPAARGRARGGQAHRREELAMADEVKLPRLGQGMEVGTIVRWLKGEGDPVAEGRAALRARHRQGHAGGRGRGVGVLLKIAVAGGRGSGRPDRRGDRRGRRGRVAARRRARAASAEKPAEAPAREPEREEGRAAAAPRPRRARRHRRPRRTAAASRRARSRAASPASAASSSRRSAAPAPRAGSSPRTSSAPRPRPRRAGGAPAPGRQRRGRVGPALERAQDDRPPAHRRVDGARLRADRVGRHDAARTSSSSACASATPTSASPSPTCS